VKEFTDVTKKSELPINRRLRYQRSEGKDSTCDLARLRRTAVGRRVASG
jgi:hypothetical protein